MEVRRSYIKNMVCQRCVMAVETILHEQGLAVKHVDLGEVEWLAVPDPAEMAKFQTALEAKGFELIDDKKSRIINQIKTLIIEQVHYQSEAPKHTLSVVLAEALHYEYNYLSNLFSEVEGSTIEKFYIEQKVEKVKELLVYDELNLNEIADQLGYSSVAHLSAQFKKVTGLTPSHFKKIGRGKRLPLDKV
ncbi:MAG TPA: AraC family transcriptional regulator [Bacteroidetes bacterium]|nr:AraC family transcriptional regulator [Bacteroidota bacterium]